MNFPNQVKLYLENARKAHPNMANFDDFFSVLENQLSKLNLDSHVQSHLDHAFIMRARLAKLAAAAQRAAEDFFNNSTPLGQGENHG
jgi:uncharacterized protein YozE (UPF0346 family)